MSAQPNNDSQQVQLCAHLNANIMLLLKQTPSHTLDLQISAYGVKTVAAKVWEILGDWPRERPIKLPIGTTWM